LSLVLVVFGNTLFFDFVWDDNILLVPVETYRHFDVRQIFFSLANGLEYLPVRDLSYALDYAIWGENPFGFHLTNIVLFALNCACFYVLVRRLIERISEGRTAARAPEVALLTTLLFAAHPIHSEVVSFVTCRNVLLSGLFFLLSCVLYLKYVSTPGPGAWRPYIASLACYVLALFSKATSIALPGALLLILVAIRPPGRRRWWSIGPFALVAAGGLVLFRAIATGASMIDSSHAIVYGAWSVSTRLALAAQIPFFYLFKIFVPTGYSAEYTVEFRQSLTSGPVLLALAVLASTVVLSLVRLRREPGVLLVAGSYLVCLVPVLNLFVTTPVVADRYVYLATCPVLAGCAYLLCAGTCFLPTVAVRSIAVVLILLLSGLTVHRNTVWKTDGSLWAATIRTSPDARNAYFNLGAYHFNRKDTDEAFRVLEQLAAVHGDDTALRYFEALDAFANDRPAEVVDKLRPIIGRDAVKPKMYLLLGRAQEQTGNAEDAIATYLDALDRRGQDPEGDLESIRTRLQGLQQRLSAELESWRDRVVQDPTDLNARARLAVRLDTLGLYDEALAGYRALVDAGGEKWQVLYNMANIYKKTGRSDEAVRAYEKSLTLNPSNPDAQNNLGVVLKRTGDHDRAIAAFEAALQIEPGFEKAAFNLATLYFRLGDRDNALRYFDLAESISPGLRERSAPYVRQMR
jgi:tetratricopeptide (TPR) repeat protein